MLYEVITEMMVSTFVTITGQESVKEAAKRLLKGETNHLPVIDAENRLIGIVTTYDVSKAFANDAQESVSQDKNQKGSHRCEP